MMKLRLPFMENKELRHYALVRLETQNTNLRAQHVGIRIQRGGESVKQRRLAGKWTRAQKIRADFNRREGYRTEVGQAAPNHFVGTHDRIRHVDLRRDQDKCDRKNDQQSGKPSQVGAIDQSEISRGTL